MHKLTTNRMNWGLCATLAGALLGGTGLLAIRARPHHADGPVAPPPERLAAAPGDRPASPHYRVVPLDAGNILLTPRAINDRGQIVGAIEHNDGSSKAFLRQHGKLTLL